MLHLPVDSHVHKPRPLTPAGCCSAQSTFDRQRGVALLMVLFALALVAVGLPVVVQQSRAELAALRELHNARQARELQRAAQLLVQAGMTQRRWRESPLFWRTLQGQWMDLPVSELAGEGLPSAQIRIRLRDLRACFNVNSLQGDAATQSQRQLRYFLRSQRSAGLSPAQLVDRLTDWVDADGQAQPQGAEAIQYTQANQPWLPSNVAMVDLSELNLLPPGDSVRVWRYPELCAWPDTGPWRLNLNALTLDQLPLLEALYEGEVPGSILQRLLLGRPAIGYASAEEVREALSGAGEERIGRILDGLVLNSERFRLEAEIELDGETYAFKQDFQLQGVSKWAARVPGQRINWLTLQRGL
ncbi:MAG: general secretion pathway protein GspK [Oceanospirillaceae bacterium]|nr:general secretion pathway protein GspK [Oceanospirillaceae bacterium]